MIRFRRGIRLKNIKQSNGGMGRESGMDSGFRRNDGVGLFSWGDGSRGGGFWARGSWQWGKGMGPRLREDTEGEERWVFDGGNGWARARGMGPRIREDTEQGRRDGHVGVRQVGRTGWFANRPYGGTGRGLLGKGDSGRGRDGSPHSRGHGGGGRRDLAVGLELAVGSEDSFTEKRCSNDMVGGGARESGMDSSPYATGAGNGDGEGRDAVFPQVRQGRGHGYARGHEGVFGQRGGWAGWEARFFTACVSFRMTCGGQGGGGWFETSPYDNGCGGGRESRGGMGPRPRLREGRLCGGDGRGRG